MPILLGRYSNHCANRLVCRGERHPAPDIVERLLALAARYQYDARVSMLEDLEAGERLEPDH
jgi:hypothetical protein